MGYEVDTRDVRTHGSSSEWKEEPPGGGPLGRLDKTDVVVRTQPVCVTKVIQTKFFSFVSLGPPIVDTEVDRKGVRPTTRTVGPVGRVSWDVGLFRV